jgi:enoyl-CoA hydratase/carnithine racemase
LHALGAARAAGAVGPSAYGATTMDELVHVDCDAGVATITLDSPANRNALSARLIADLHAALDEAEAGAAADAVRAIVLTHVPPAFCAGADLKERRTGPPDSGPMVHALQRLMDAPVPTIAAVNGPARAGGIGLMASCDLVVVRSDVTFALTEVRIGVAAAIISVPILRRASGSRLAAAFLTGEPFDAAAARDVGLITHVSDDVDATVAQLCAGIKMGAPRAVAETKRMLRDVPGLERDVAFERMRQLSEELFGGPDAAEGMAAFAERRPPSWQLREHASDG